MIESLATPTKVVDFYIEEWLFKEPYTEEKYNKKNKVTTPLGLMYTERCFYDRNKRSSEYPCIYPNIRWQSADPRNIFTREIEVSIMRLIKLFIETDKLYLGEFKIVFEEILPFLSELRTKSFLIPLFTRNRLFKKEFNKQEDQEATLDLLQQYINYTMKDVKIDNIEKIIKIFNDNNFPEHENEEPENTDIKIDNTLRFNLKNYLHKKTNKDTEQFKFCDTIVSFYNELIPLTSFLLDIYTILRIYKKSDVSPYFLFCYFGQGHIRNLFYFFTTILKSYTPIIVKQPPEKPCLQYSPEINCRCISFEKGEYIENNKEILQLSGPVSFYKLKANHKDIRPYYITLFGDIHGSVKQQCKDCNFDYFNYYNYNDKLE